MTKKEQLYEGKAKKDGENIIALAREGKASYNAELEAIMKEFRPKK